MKLLFVHDHPFRRVKGKIYSTGGLDNSVLSRYTRYCDELSVVARIRNENNVNSKWSLITNPKVNIYGNNSFKCEELEREVESCNKMIVRLPSFIGIKALEINKKYNKPYLIEMVACPWDALWNHSIKGKLVAPFIFMKNKQLLKNAPYVLYVTQDFLQRRYPSSGKTLGCSDVEIMELDDAIEMNRISNLKKDRTVLKIGTVAAVDVRFKGQEYVIRALGELKKYGNTRYEYYLVGNGSDTRLKKVADESNVLNQVHFVGGIPHEKVFNWLDSIDLYIQPSKQEGLPRAVVEAMSRGLPVLGSQTGGIPELVPEQYLFKNGDYKAIANILQNLDKEDFIHMSKESFKKAHDYQKEILDKKRENFYKMFIENREEN